MKHIAIELDTDEPRDRIAMPLIIKVALWRDHDPFAGVVRIDHVAYYTMDQVAKILHVRQSKVRALSRREHDPLPFVVVDSCSVPLIMADALGEWVIRNSVPLTEAIRA